MLEIIDSKIVESVSDIKRRYPNCMLEVKDLTDDFNGTITAKLYAVSHDESSYRELCDLNNELYDNGIDASIIGDYDGGYNINVQYIVRQGE